MSSEVLGLHGYRPAPDCAKCRLGTVTVPCRPDDVRRLTETVDSMTLYGISGGWIEGVPVEPPVKLHRNQVVQGDGPVPCPVMLIGEAPGFHEDREGRGFQENAPAGRVLAEAMQAVSLARVLRSPVSDNLYSPEFPVYVTNIVKCRPPDNKLDRYPDAVETCRSEFLLAEIEAVQPKVVVCLGKVAAQHWFGSQPALALRQVVIKSTWMDDEVNWAPLFIHAPHPSYIARGNVEAKGKLLEALRVAKEVGYPQVNSKK